MSNKTISINPGLFSLGGSKTKKNKKDKLPPSIKPLISPNVLKNKLLKRIKEHKHRETDNFETNKSKLPEVNLDFNKKNESNDFSDEFNDSINYLQTLSQQKKTNDVKVTQQKRRTELERKTIKNYQSSEPFVNIDLPEELQINTQPLELEPSLIINPIKNDSVPYGVLKGGLKPTYRDWTKTQRNNIVTNPNDALTIQGGEVNRLKNERENRLNLLREKLKTKQLQETLQKTEDIMLTQNLIQKPIQEPIILDTIQNQNIPKESGNVIAIKKIIKKTIKKKYTLGKSKIKKTVAVLIKDRGTRKQILTAQKELKRKPINDINLYLRDHNLIKIGSTAPNDVIRKLYESAMLAGEITNSNSENLLYNFTKDEKEL
jgi:hypothetical protein